MNRRGMLMLSFGVAVLAGCRLGPDYERPGVPVGFRFGKGESGVLSLGDLDWRSVFTDPVLRDLIGAALEASPDLAEAAARVLRAQANVTVVRSQFYPSFGAGLSLDRRRVDQDLQIGPLTVPDAFDSDQFTAGLTLMQYEVDFWGRIRRATEVARAQMVATEEGRRLVESGLVAAVATAYFTLREQDHELEIAERTLKSRRDSLELITVRQQGGQGALTDVRQAEVLVAEAEAAIKAIERQVAKLEHEISYLCGRVPAEVRRGRPFVELSSMVTAPAGLPSDLLNRRPDIRRAEQNLVAATAAVGEAEARRYPAFALTAGAGLRSDEFSGLLSDPVKFWQVGPALTVPVFTGGRLRAGVAGAKAGRDEAEAAYRRTVLQGMRDVSDALVAVEKNAGLREAQGKVVAARTAAAGLIRDRWDNGVASYLEVLYNDQELFQAELNHARARLEELTAGISLYRALGGGWGRE